MRRGDAVTTPSHGYDGHSIVQVMLATAPTTIYKALQIMNWSSIPIVLFSNERNSDMFRHLRKTFTIITEAQLLATLPQHLRAAFTNPESFYLLLSEVARGGVGHICTVEVSHE